jgi:hypothetical protein
LFSVHLVGRDASWNLKVFAVPRGKALRGHNPLELVELGLVVLRQMVLNLSTEYVGG